MQYSQYLYILITGRGVVFRDPWVNTSGHGRHSPSEVLAKDAGPGSTLVMNDSYANTVDVINIAWKY